MERPPDAPRAVVEPAWHRIDESATRGRRDPIEVPDHAHAQQQRDEAEVAIDLRQRMNVDCGNIGFHRHLVPGKYVTSSRSDQWPHHHHDLRCLFEAGVQSLRPKMIDQERRLASQASQVRHLRQRVDEEQARARTTQRTLDAARGTMTEMVQFMESMPAVGPWKSVYDQYLAWVDEKREEASDG